MIYLLIAVAVCLLVPWLPVWVYRCLPRRPPDPLPEGELQRLAARMRPASAEEAVAMEPPRTDILRRSDPAAKAATHDAEKLDQKEETNTVTRDCRHVPDLRLRPPRLALPSYRWVNVAALPFVIGGFLFLGASWAALFHYLGEEHARGFQPAVFLFKPFAYGLICFLPALFLGIFTTLPVLVGLARLLMGRRRFLEYLFWDEGRLSTQYVDGLLRMFRLMAILFATFSALYIVRVMNWYARLSEDEIAIVRFTSFREEVHPYSSVEEIVLTSHHWDGKNATEGEDLGIRFSDGRKWNTDQTFMMPHDTGERDRLLDFLRRKTGKPILRVRLLSEVPGWD
jgi:hypothetical protein